MLDEWFEQVARPRLKGRCQLVRYADDAVIAFEDHLSGKRLLNVLDKRLGRYGLQLHPTKTRFVDFRFKRPGGRHPATVNRRLTGTPYRPPKGTPLIGVLCW
ncbi:reverse transcriptase domain-containing protein [Bradyrhizobium japonicum]|uniref:reverse transcriptase domain-containing protein n=1 Tax=Bradyrhizobium japonicum TaxID=375 RepID=UPI00321196DD